MSKDRAEYANSLHDRKYNCCQSVILAFADDLGVDKQLLFKAAEGFGGGMGGKESVCGALSGAVMAAGLKNSDGNLEDPQSKASTKLLSKEMTEKFVERVGALLCKDIKLDEPEVPLCSCADCIRIAVGITEEVLGY